MTKIYLLEVCDSYICSPESAEFGGCTGLHLVSKLPEWRLLREAVAVGASPFCPPRQSLPQALQSLALTHSLAFGPVSPTLRASS